MLQFLILFILILLTLRFLRKGFHRWLQGFDPKNLKDQNNPLLRESQEMKACAQCGTYSPAKLGLFRKGLYFCDGECQKTYFRQR